MRKYHIDYNADFDGVEIYSDDYYEYGDYDDTIDSRTGQKWGPYDFMAFSDEQLDEAANPAQQAAIAINMKKHHKKPKGVAEGGYNDYDNNRTGFSRDNTFRNRERNAGLENETNNIQISINGRPWKVVPGRGYADSREEREYLNNMRKWAEKKSAASGKKWTVSLTGANPTVNELSNEKLGQYKQAAALDAGAADKRGDYDRADKRFSGIIKATKKQFANDVKKHKPTNEESSTASDAVERAILNRIMTQHTDLLMKFGPEKVMQAAEEVAYGVGDVDEIGTSDVSAYVNQVRQILGA
jgi:hypothetical protein